MIREGGAVGQGPFGTAERRGTCAFGRSGFHPVTAGVRTAAVTVLRRRKATGESKLRGMRGVGRAAEVLELFSVERPYWGPTEVAAEVAAKVAADVIAKFVDAAVAVALAAATAFSAASAMFAAEIIGKSD